LGGVLARLILAPLVSRRCLPRLVLGTVVAALAIPALAAGQALADSFYVSPQGSDSNPGTEALPWRTVSHAASTVGPGATVLIAPGTYAEAATLLVSGTEEAPITFKSESGEAPTLQSLTIGASYVTVKGLTIAGASRDCVTVEPQLTHVAIRANVIGHCGRDGIHFTRPGSVGYTSHSVIAGNAIKDVGLVSPSGSDMTIYGDWISVRGNNLTGAPGDAVDMWGDHLSFRQNSIHDIVNLFGGENAFHTWTGVGDGVEGNPVTNLVMAQNRVTNILGADADGVLATGPGHENWSVYDNIFDGIGGVGIRLQSTNASDLDVYNNTFFRAGSEADVEFGEGASGLFADNIVRGGGGITISDPAGVTEDYNVLYNAAASNGGGPHDIKANPDFVDPLAGDFYLDPESPAIDAGDDGSIAPLRRFDFAGNPIVGVNDIGAYEYQGAGQHQGAGPPFRGAQVHSLWSSVSRAEMTAELNALQGARANVLRVDVGWGSLETAKGQYDSTYLGKLDALASEAQARGIKLIATLWWTPSWASVGGSPYDAPANPSDYGDFARFITSRYGTELAAVEAWNEPNWNNNLIASNVPLAYTQMVKAFYAGAKQGNPGVAVLAGSLAYADLTFLGELYADGIKGYYDGISLHPYADGAPPEDTAVTHSFLGGIEKMHLFQVANGDSTPEWVTEFGWPVGTSPGANTEAQQAEYIEKAFALVSGLPYVTGATVYQLRDMETNASNAEDNFGLLHQDFTPRPSYAAFTRAMQAAGSG
jgi:polysaccharide biosynthesis protein PslG